MSRTLTLVLSAIVISIHLVDIASAEIHRAKTVVSKSGSGTKSQFSGQISELEILDLESDVDIAGVSKQSDVVMDEITDTSSRSEAWLYSIISAIIVGLSGVFPLLVIPIESGPQLLHGASGSRLKVLLSFAVGGLLGDVFLHLLPEAWAHVKNGDHNEQRKIGLWVIAGMLSFLIIEKIFAGEHEFDVMEDDCLTDEEEADDIDTEQTTLKQNGRQKQIQQNGCSEHLKLRKNSDNNNPPLKPEKTANGLLRQKSQQFKKQKSQEKKNINNEPIKVSGYLNLLANVIDNFTHGLAVGGSYLVSTKVGVLTTFAILVHEIPHEVGDFAILLRSGFDRWKAAKGQLLTATGGLVGAMTALLSESPEKAGRTTAWILPFTSGGFIYIALVTVVPDLLQEKHPWESCKQVIGIILGIVSMVMVTVLFG